MNLKSLSIIIPIIILAGACFCMLAGGDTSPGDQQRGAVTNNAIAAPQVDSSGVPLGFDEIFVMPAGPLGLEYTAKAKSLIGKRVSITGYMLRNDNIDPAIFFLCETPRSYNEREEGLADSLPPSMVHVILPVKKDCAPAWRGEKMNLYGTLELGPRQELSGRVSNVRLQCDAITDAASGAVLEVRKPIALQLGRAVPPTSDLGALPAAVTPPLFFNPRRNTDSTTLHPDKL
jgi:hypothetical protein